MKWIHALALYLLTPRASSISESRSTLKGDAYISLPDTAPESALFSNKQAKYDLESEFEWPRSIGVGISHKLGASHRFSSELSDRERHCYDE